MRSDRVIGRVVGIVLVCLTLASTFGGLPSSAYAAKFDIGDNVEVITNLNVRTGPGTSYPEITDPDYPGYAPAGTKGKVLDGPISADGYVWWKVDYGPGLYLGWSVEGGLTEIVTQSDLTVTSVNAPTSAEPGGYIAVSWTVKNQGNVSSGSFHNRISLATTPYGTDISLGNFSMSSISPGASLSDAQVPKIPESVSAGYYYVTVFADTFQSIAESNENNNINKAPSQIHIIAPTETISTPNTPSGPTTGTVGVSYTYSTGGAASNLGHSVQYRFDWGDGSYSVWSSSTSASYSWSSPGTYIVKAQARCAIHTSVMSTWSSGLTVSIPPPLVADFVAAPREGTAPLTVQFTDKSTGIIDSWTWGFGDGGTGTQRNPTHTYTMQGTYTVSLTVAGPAGKDTAVKSGYIIVRTPVVGGSISGHVYQSNGVTPIEGAMVGVFDYGSPANYGWVSTGADGGYRFDSLEAGTYAVRVEAVGYAVEWYDGVIDKSQAIPVSVVTPGDTSGIDFTLEPGGSIVGHVYESDGVTRIEGATITVWDYDSLLGPNSVNYESGWTGTDGSYRTGGLPFGTYGLRVVAKGYAVEWYDDTHNMTEVVPVSVTPPDDTLGIDFNLAPGGSIVGHVYQADSSTPIEDARVTVFEHDSQSNRWLHYFGGGARTDAEGYYMTGGLPSGQYKVRAYAEGYPEVWYDNTYDMGQATPVSVSAPSDTFAIDFILAPAITRVWTSETIRGPEVTHFPAGTDTVCVNYAYTNPIGSVQKIVWYDAERSFTRTATHITEFTSGVGTWSLTNTKAFGVGGSFQADLFINDLLLANVSWAVGPVKYYVYAHSVHFVSGYYVELMVDDPDATIQSVSVTGPGIDGSTSLVRGIHPFYPDQWWSQPNVNLGTSPPGLPLVYTFTITEKTGSTCIVKDNVLSYVESFATNLSPSNGETVTGELVFSWTGIDIPDVRYRIELYDAARNRIWDSPTISNTSYSYDGLILAPGDYRYYICSYSKYGDSSLANATFRVAGLVDTIPPTVVSVSPQDGATNVRVDTVLTVRFSEAIAKPSAPVVMISPSVGGCYNWGDNVMIFKFSDALAYNTTYTVTITTDVKDLAGNPLAEPYIWSFTTEQAPAAKPVLTSPLNISPEKDEYFVGDGLTASFTIKNRGNAPVTLDVLTVGGRLNGWCPAEGCPDFTHQPVTLQAFAFYQYEGSLTLTEAGNYHFFIAYYIEDPTPEEKEYLDENNWNTCVELGEGLTDADRIENIIVFNEEVPPPDSAADLLAKINQELQQQVQYPPYLLDPDSFTSAVASLWANFTSWVTQTDLTDKYDQLYHTGIDYDCLSVKALINARDALNNGDIAAVQEYLQDHYAYEKLSAMSFGAAAEVFDNNLEAGELLAEGIKNGCQAAVKFGLAIINPEAAKAADYIYIGADFVVDYVLRGEDDALKDAIVEAVVTGLLNEVQFEAFGDRTIADYIENRIGKVTFPILQNAFKSEQVQFALSRIIKECGVEIAEEVAKDIASRIQDELRNAVDLEQAEVKSPVELRICDYTGKAVGLVNGHVEHTITRSVYNAGEITIFFPSGAYVYQLAGKGVGSYSLEITRVEGAQITSFTALDIPTSTCAMHEYTIDWDAISEGEEGVTLQIDSDGDGEFERTVAADNELTIDEFWPYSFEDSERGTKLRINTYDQTFQFIAPDKEFPIKQASSMRVVDLSEVKATKYNWFSRNWRIDTRELDLDSELKAHVVKCRFKERPEELIIIHHQDEGLWLSAIAVDENKDFCVMRAKDIETGKHCLLLDRRGVEPSGTTTGEPEADFAASRTEGRAPLFVRFTDMSTGEITSWLWDFGDGKTSTRQNPFHVYWQPGSYTVTLTVSGPGGSDTMVMGDYIVVERLHH